MSNMPDELKEVFAVLSKYQFQPPFENDWGDFSDVNRYKNYEFRLRREKPLTVEEALKLDSVFVPMIDGVTSWFFRSELKSESRRLYADKGLAYATVQGAITHAQMWLDMKVEE